jgi:hypothetical protein
MASAFSNFSCNMRDTWRLHGQISVPVMLMYFLHSFVPDQALEPCETTGGVRRGEKGS